MTPNDAKEDRGHSDVHLDLPSSSRLSFSILDSNYPILNAQDGRIKIKIKIKIKGLVYFSPRRASKQKPKPKLRSKVKNED